MTLLPLTMGAVNYDRFQAIRDGSVRVEGIDLEIVPLEVEEIFYRQMKYHEFDVSEMSMSSYLAGIDAGDFPYIALPVFPLGTSATSRCSSVPTAASSALRISSASVSACPSTRSRRACGCAG